MWVLDQQAFDKLLARLDPDRDRAGAKYETIRRKLIKFFEWRGCLFPEDFSDETINRVARKIDEGEEISNLSSYFLGVARLVFKEYLRQQERQPAGLDPQPPPLPVEVNPSESDPRRDCLDQCLNRLAPHGRQLVRQYYQGEKSDRIKNRKKLAEQLGIPLNALRIRAHRLRAKLEACVTECLKK